MCNFPLEIRNPQIVCLPLSQKGKGDKGKGERAKVRGLEGRGEERSAGADDLCVGVEVGENCGEAKGCAMVLWSTYVLAADLFLGPVLYHSRRLQYN